MVRSRRGVVLVVVGVLLAAILAVGSFGGRSRERLAFAEPHRRPRPAVHGRVHMASTGTPWATQAALDVLDGGGNAFDAAVAALLALNVTYPEAACFPSIAPTLVFDAQSREVSSYRGVGTAPAAATLAAFRGEDSIPGRGIRAQLVPASPDVLVALLARSGTRSFGEVSAAAVRLADEGFPVHDMMLAHLDLAWWERLGYRVLMPYNAQIYLGHAWWQPLEHGERFRQPDLARTFRRMASAERLALEAGGDRAEGLAAVRRWFYEGPGAQAIAELHAREGGLMTAADLAAYRGAWERPLTGRFGPYTLHANGTWTQGAVVPLALGILASTDVARLEPGSAAWIHTLAQALELAMADREAYFADPELVDVPAAELLAPGYAARRAALMTPGRAFDGPPPAGVVAGAAPPPAGAPLTREGEQAVAPSPARRPEDTSYLAVTDRWGNSVSMTPSDFPLSPMVPGTGMCLGIRLSQFRLAPGHPNVLAPGKRPRVTPNASMVTRDGELVLTLGTPEDDQQPQALVQVLVRHLVHGADLQQAIDAPRFRDFGFPASFSPHAVRPRTLRLERSLAERTGSELEAMGYVVEVVEDWHHEMGAVSAIRRDPGTGALVGAADARQENWAAGR